MKLVQSPKNAFRKVRNRKRLFPQFSRHASPPSETPRRFPNTVWPENKLVGKGTPFSTRALSQHAKTRIWCTPSQSNRQHESLILAKGVSEIFWLFRFLAPMIQIVLYFSLAHKSSLAGSNHDASADLWGAPPRSTAPPRFTAVPWRCSREPPSARPHEV